VIERWALTFPLKSEEAGRPHTEMAGVVWRRVTNKKTGETTEGCRLYVSSVEPHAKRKACNRWLLDISRGHWTVENNVHWVRDAVNKEDAGRIRSGHIAAALGLLGTSLLALQRAAGLPSPTKAAESCSQSASLALNAILNQRLGGLKW
jgi:predicted transposase YbfD/YdcC